ncbi:MAG: sulfotransferase [Hyphomonadaceae bacterium]
MHDRAKPELDHAIQLMRTGRSAEAAHVLEGLAASEESVGRVHALYLEVLTATDRKRALEVLDRTVQLPTDDADAFDALAFFARQLDRHELSRDLYEKASKRAPNDAQIWYNFATSERALGRLAEAGGACNHALTLQPDYRPALLLRSEMNRATPSDNNVEDLRSRLASAPQGPDSMYLQYALGKELHELGRYDEAFEAFKSGANARRRCLRYDVSEDENKLRRIAEVFAAGAAPPPAVQPGRNIFIIGLPRSGTTLTERIVGGLAGVRSNNETNNFSTALLRFSPSEGRDVFERAAKADYANVAREYDALAAADGFAGKIIEKLPFNYLYVGPILRAFPATPIIWVRRDPIDSCFAMFRTLFGAAYPFSYDFEELARYYAAYHRLMQHWVRIYPGQVTTVDYEELVASPDAVGQHLADSCGLTWRADAVDIARNKSASLTASAAQVRSGIYSSSSGLWRKYREHLRPLADHLKANGIETQT